MKQPTLLCHIFMIYIVSTCISDMVVSSDMVVYAIDNGVMHLWYMQHHHIQTGYSFLSNGPFDGRLMSWLIPPLPSPRSSSLPRVGGPRIAGTSLPASEKIVSVS